MNHREVKYYYHICSGIFVLLLVAFISFFGRVGEAINNVKYRIYGKQTMGVVVDKQMRTSYDSDTGRKYPFYYLKVEYSPESTKKMYKFEVPVSVSDFENFQPNDRILVEYLNPKKATGRVYQEPDNVELLILLGSIAAIIGAMIFLKIKGDKDENERDQNRKKFGAKYRTSRKKHEK